MPSRLNVPCSLCHRSGLIRPGQICPSCEGAGYVAELKLAFSVLTPDDVAPYDEVWWERLLVLSTFTQAGRTIVSGISELGRPITAMLKAEQSLEAAPAVLRETKGIR